MPWKNKELELKWEHFVSKLQPGQKETWTLVVQSLESKVQSPKSEGRSAEKAVAEMVATLYDESLDAFAPLDWPRQFSVFCEDDSSAQSQFGNTLMGFQQVFGSWDQPYEAVEISYRSFPPDLTVNLWGYGYFTAGLRGRRSELLNFAAAPPMAKSMAEMPTVATAPEPAGVFLAELFAAELFRGSL